MPDDGTMLPSSSPLDEFPHTEADDALRDVRPEMAALRREELRRPTADPVIAAGVTLVAQPFLESLRTDIERLPRFEVRNLDNLRKYALATWLTNNRNLPKSTRKREVVRLTARALKIRDRLFVAAQSLVFDEVLDAGELASIKRQPGPRWIAGDITKLASMYLAAGDAITGKSIVTLESAREAEILGTRLIGLASMDDSVDVDRIEADDDFVRAFMLLDRAYAQCRRAGNELCFGDRRLATRMPNYYAVQVRKRPRAKKVASPGEGDGPVSPPV